MTPKEEYKIRKAERRKLKELDKQLKGRTEQEMMLDTLDRFVTAIERIANVMESRKL